MLVLIDGHRVNDSLQDYAGLGQDFLVDMQNIERIEVVRGPGSALYGSNALFAVINVITQRGRDVQGARISGDLGSYGSNQGQVSAGKRYASGVETFLSASHYHSDGHEQLSFPGLGTSFNADGEDVERLHGKLSWNDFMLSGSWMGRTKHLPTGTTGTTFGNSNSDYRDNRAYADLNYHHLFDNDWDFTGRAFWDNYLFDDALPYLNAQNQQVTNRDSWNDQWFGTETSLSHTFFEKHRLTVGNEFRRNYVQLMSNYDAAPYYASYANTRQTSSVIGIYAQDEWSISHNIALEYGGRYDHYDSFGGTFNPRAGLIYTPRDGTTLKLLFGTAFRAPNAFENAYTCCANTSSPWIGNAKLAPEHISTYELVWEQRLNNNFDLRVDPYYNYLRNLIGLTTSNQNVKQYQNLGDATAYGIETQLSGRNEYFEMRLSHTYQNSQIQGYSTAPNAPQQMLKLNLSVPVWQDKLYTSLESQYVSGRTTTLDARISGYTFTNLIVFTRHFLPGIEFTGGIYNLFNEQYSDPASQPIAAQIVPQNGRNWRLRLTYEF
jgi:outer membrane receptor for ferrienterochelin and colicins